MTIQEFVDKWGYQSGFGQGSAQFDCREALKKDLDKLFEEKKCKHSNKHQMTNSPYEYCPDCDRTVELNLST